MYSIQFIDFRVSLAWSLREFGVQAVRPSLNGTGFRFLSRHVRVKPMRIGDLAVLLIEHFRRNRSIVASLENAEAFKDHFL